jgi:cyclophilin family peptidyl-prolyl cis-trans isomerase
MFSPAVRRFWFLLLLAFSGTSLLARAVAPVAPTNCAAVALSATASAATVEISWNDNSTNETQWLVQVSVGGGAYSYLSPIGSGSIASTGIASIALDVPLNSVVRFIVQSSNGSEFSAISNVATVGTFDLNQPINFSVTALDPFNVSLRWEEGSISELGFAIERKIGTGPWEYLGAVGANVLSLTSIQLIAPLATYSFRVRAFKLSEPTTPDSPVGPNVSAYSNVATISSGAYTLTASAVPGQTAINLSWPNIQNESGYNIFYLPADAGFGASYSYLGALGPNVTSYQFTAPTIEPAKTYYFIVQPFVGSVEEGIGESNPATATVDGMTSKTGTSGTPGGPLSHTFTQVTGSTVSSRALTGVPGGLSFNTSTGVLSGAYPALGNYTLNYSVTFANGGVLTQTFHIRVRPPAGAPVVGTVIPAWTANTGAIRDTPLAGTFTDAEAESAVRVSTTLGDMDFILFNSATPATVTNFMHYVNAGKYSDVAFHRSIAGFVIQGGGFKGTGVGSDFNSVVTNPTVVNEPGIANEFGTVSMAKLGGDPNSATSQFFVSLGDNRANLDYQNGGFTVFGRVAGNGMAVAQAISDQPNDTYSLFLNGGATATPFTDFPLNVASMPAPMDQTKLVKMNSVTTIPTISYSVTGNTNPAVASAGIVGGLLRLVGLSGGQTTVTLTATDLDNLTTTQTVAVTINDTFATWVSRSTFPNGQSASGQNPDADVWNNLQEYAFLGDPGVAGSATQTVFPGSSGTAPKYLTLTFPVRKSTQGLTYAVEANNGLSGPWTEVWKSTDGLGHAQVVTAQDQADRTVLTVKDSAAVGAGKRFLRVRVVQE